jgi:hypothetical protein
MNSHNDPLTVIPRQAQREPESTTLMLAGKLLAIVHKNPSLLLQGRAT